MPEQFSSTLVYIHIFVLTYPIPRERITGFSNMPVKSKAEEAAMKTIREYLQSDDYYDGIEKAVYKAVSKELGKLIKRLSKIEKVHENIIERLDHNDVKLLEFESILQSKEVEITRLNHQLRNHQSSIDNFKMSLNDTEQYFRRNCIKFYGVEEMNREGNGSMNENSNDVICKLVTLGVSLTPNDIDRSHRIAAPKRDEAHGTTSLASDSARASKKPRPRAIIVKLTTYRMRTEILKVRRKQKGSGIGIDEALTKTNQDLPYAAKQHEKVKETWTSDGRVIVLLPATRGNAIKRVIRSKEELKWL